MMTFPIFVYIRHLAVILCNHPRFHCIKNIFCGMKPHYNQDSTMETTKNKKMAWEDIVKEAVNSNKKMLLDEDLLSEDFLDEEIDDAIDLGRLTLEEEASAQTRCQFKKVAVRRKPSDIEYYSFAKKCAERMFIQIGIAPVKEDLQNICAEKQCHINIIGPTSTIVSNNSGQCWAVQGRRIKISHSPHDFTMWKLNSTLGERTTVYYFAVNRGGTYHYARVRRNGSLILLKRGKDPIKVDIEHHKEHLTDPRAFVKVHDHMSANEHLAPVVYHDKVLKVANNDFVIATTDKAKGSHWDFQ